MDEEVLEVPIRKRRTYVTLERVIRFGKTVGCEACDRIAEGVRRTDECHARIDIKHWMMKGLQRKRRDQNVK